MNLAVAQDILATFCKRWQKRLCIKIWIKAITMSLIIMAVVNVFTATSDVGLILIALLSSALLFTGLFFLTKITRVSSLTIAHHLNRMIPELEESCDLLLNPGNYLSVLEKMQRKRTLRTFSSICFDELLPKPIPRGKWLVGFWMFLLAFIGSTFVPENWLERQAFPQGSVFGGEETVAKSPDELPPQIESVKILVKPPAYMGKSPYILSSLEITAEEGALVSWDIEFNERASNIFLVFSGGDTLTLPQGKDLHCHGTRRVSESGFYCISITMPGGHARNSQFHRLEIATIATRTSLPPMWFFATFLVSCAYLWLENKM